MTTTTNQATIIPVGVSRVSERGGREDNQIYSFGNQDAKQRLLWQTQGWGEGKIYREPFISGGNSLEDRPGLLAAVRDIEEGRAHVLTVAFRNRLDREPAVRDQVIARVEKASGMVWTGDIGRDTNATPAQQFSGTILSASDRMQRQEAGVRSRLAVADAIALGKWPRRGTPPGYRKGPDGILVPHEPEIDVMKRFFAMRLEGTPIEELRLFLREHGIERAFGAVQGLLANHAYIGEIEHGSYAPNPEAHEAIIDRDVFDAVQKMVIPRGRRGKSELLLARVGVLRCSMCGGRMCAGDRGERKGLRYRCPSHGDCQAKQSIAAHLVDEAVAERMKSEIGDAKGSASKLAQARAAAERAEALDAKVQGMIARALDMDISDEPATKEAIDKAKAERTKAQALADTLGKVADARKKLVRLDKDWDDLSLKARRELIRAFVEIVEVSPGVGADRISIRMVGE